jgi:hypothetical protein
MKRWAALWRALRRVPLPSVPPAGAFTSARTSVFHVFAIGLTVVTLFEAPVVHLLIHRAGWGWHVAVGFVNVYTVVWLLGERRLLQESWHRLGHDALEVAVGGRWAGRIPYAAIASVAPTDGAGARRRGVLRVTPVDTPNVEVRLREDVTLYAMGLPRRGRSAQLFVDEPAAFVAAVAEATARSGRS